MYQFLSSNIERKVSVYTCLLNLILATIWIESHCSQGIIRPRNINWQDWKYTSFGVFVSYSQNIRRHNAMCRDELVADVVKKIELKFQFSS